MVLTKEEASLGQVFITWELGAGFGHLATMRSVSMALLVLGHRVAIAARDLTHFHRFFSDLDVQVFQAPYFRGTFLNSFNPPSTFPHILYNCCCGNTDTFVSLAKAWQNLFDLIKPDVALFDHSPTAIFATRDRSFYRATINNGFFAPPNESPLPSWRSQSENDLSRFASDETRVLDLLNISARRLSATQLGQVSDLYSELNENFLFTYPELDHFPNRRHANYVGTWESSSGNTPHWPTSNGPRVFAYLKKFPNLPVLLYHLARLQLPTVIYAPGAITDEFLRKFSASQSNVRVVNSTINLKRVAVECDFAITNGTHGTVATMLLAGKPTLNFPLLLEQRILSDRVCAGGMGLGASPDDQSRVKPALQNMLETATLSEHALQFRQKYIHHDGVDRVLQDLNSVMSSDNR